VEGDDMNDPIADAARSILDGHVVLDRRLATSGHFPSIDVLESISRSVNAITTPEQRSDATVLRQLMAARRDAKDLVEIGAYVAGSNPLVDRALAKSAAIDQFLRQPVGETADPVQSWAMLHELAATA
jgi:flagellum-specific ATP synthase